MINKFDKIGLINKITPVLPVVALVDESQTLHDRIASFVVGREYSAKILSRNDAQTAQTQTLQTQSLQVQIDKTIFNIKLDAGQLATKTNLTPGQTLVLKYISGQTIDGEFRPAFMLEAVTLLNLHLDGAVLSKAGQLISQSLAQIGQHSLYKAVGNSNAQQYQALKVLTAKPENSQVVMHDLKQALSSSGLFYESHLADYVEGKRTLSDLILEPQNKANFDSATLLVKQLDILEQNKILWSGQVWAGQHLDWEIRRENNLQSQADEHQPDQVEPNTSPMTSTLALNLPNLGRVTTTLKIQDGHLSIHIQAAVTSTAALLKKQVPTLSGALQKSGQQLDTLMVEQYA